MKLHRQIIQFLETSRFVNLEVEKRFFDVVSKMNIMDYHVSTFHEDSTTNTITGTIIYGFDIDNYYSGILNNMNLLEKFVEYQAKVYSSW